MFLDFRCVYLLLTGPLITLNAAQLKMNPHLFRSGNDELVNNLEVNCGNAVVNGFPMTHLHSMVHIAYRFKKSEAISGCIEQAKSIKRREGQKRGGETTGTRSQSPERITTKVVFEVIFTINTARDTRQQDRFIESMGS